MANGPFPYFESEYWVWYKALEAIFEDDEYFTKISDTKFQYKIKDENPENTNANFLIEFIWGENYPDEAPQFSLDSFFNIHLNDKTKEVILGKLQTFLIYVM